MLHQKKTTVWIFRAGLLTGSAYFVLIPFRLILYGVPASLSDNLPAPASVILLAGVAFLGLIFGFYYKKEGGLVMIASGTMIYLHFAYGSMGEYLTSWIISLPLVVSGGLFYCAARREKAGKPGSEGNPEVSDIETNM